MKALTLTQPWATLVATGAKKIETRSWSTSHRGPLAIHAAKAVRKQDVIGFWREEPFKTALHPHGNYLYPQFEAGSVLAICRLVGCLQIDNLWRAGTTVWVGNYATTITEAEYEFGDYTPGRWAWLLADVKKLEPIPAKGALGLWEWNNPADEMGSRDEVGPVNAGFGSPK